VAIVLAATTITGLAGWKGWHDSAASQRLDQRAARLTEDVHQVVRRLPQVLNDNDGLSAGAELRDLDQQCEYLWSQLPLAVRGHSDDLGARNDWLDLVIFWSDLRARLTPNLSAAEMARRVQEEAEEFFGRDAFAARLQLLAPRRAEAYYNLGRSYIAMGLRDKANASLTRAIELDAELAVAFFQRGILAYQDKRYDQALADFNQAA